MEDVSAATMMRSFRLRVEDNIENGYALRAREIFYAGNLCRNVFVQNKGLTRKIIFARSRFGVTEAEVAA